MIMHLDYEFTFKGVTYDGQGIDIGDTDDIEKAKEDVDENKKSAVCDAFNIDIDEFEANYNLADFEFSYCNLYN